MQRAVSAVSVLLLCVATAHGVALSATEEAGRLAALRAGWDQANWKEAHGAVAVMAQKWLTPQAAAAAKDLVPDLRAEAGWADRIVFTEPKQTWSSPLHFINLPNKACAFVRSRDCKNREGQDGWCVDGAIQNYTARLADVKLPKEQRAEALKFLVHFIGDIHQPLHVGNGDDWGGNKLTGSFMGGAPSNLHAIWDAALGEHRVKTAHGGDANKWIAAMAARVTSAQRTAWSKCKAGAKFGHCSDEWATESAKLACQYAYVKADKPTELLPANFNLDAAYFNRVIPIVETALQKAAVRLSNVLNLVFAAAKPAAGAAATAAPGKAKGPAAKVKSPVKAKAAQAKAALKP